jgi:multiple antibiotic resistance protein
MNLTQQFSILVGWVGVNGTLMVANTYQHYLIGLLAVANNFSAIAPFLANVGGLKRANTRKLAAITSIACLMIMLTFLLFGTTVLSFFGISISEFQIAGGVLLGGIGLNMMNTSSVADVSGKTIDHASIDRSALISTAIVPIAIPLTTGAGTISMVTVFAHAASLDSSRLALLLAILTVVVINFIVFMLSTRIIKLIGTIGLTVFTKVMGLFTLAIGVSFIVEGSTAIIETLPGFQR